MTIPMYDKSETNPRELLLDAMSEVVDLSWYEAGKVVQRFEAAFTKYIGAQQCVSCASGTDALILALKALNVNAGDRVALVANAGFYGSIAVYSVGAVPVYIDVEEASLCMCPVSLERSLARQAIKAVIVTHLYGQLASIDAISDLCQDHGVALIEDCAQACGATNDNGRQAGSFGDIACFSFYPTKNLGAYGDGGALCCNNEELAVKLRAIKQYGWHSKYQVDVTRGMNSRLDPIQAAILWRKLPLLNEWNARRRAIAQQYTAALSEILHCPAVNSDYVAHLYVARSPNRDALRAELTNRGIMSDIHYPIPDYRQPAYTIDDVFLPATEASVDQVVSLPCFPGLSDSSVQKVIDAVKAWAVIA